jgi:Winged helix DNA-binding domain
MAQHARQALAGRNGFELEADVCFDAEGFPIEYLYGVPANELPPDATLTSDLRGGGEAYVRRLLLSTYRERSRLTLIRGRGWADLRAMKRTLSTGTLRAFRAHRQGLDGTLAGRSPAEVLERTGWARSVGGASPYLAFFARAGTPREAADAALAAVAIHELPSARSCTYIIPAADYALALRAGQGRGEAAEIEMARKHCGVTAEEIDGLCVAVVAALEERPRDPKDTKDVLGGRVRHLGEVGKKRGLTTTLPLALGCSSRWARSGACP